MGRWSKAREIAECCVCGRYGRGVWLPKGGRKPHTRETPCDNFICVACQEEATAQRRFGGSGRRCLFSICNTKFLSNVGLFLALELTRPWLSSNWRLSAERAISSTAKRLP